MKDIPDKEIENVSTLYERLSRLVQIVNWLKFGNRYAGYTMHKSLIIPADRQGKYHRKNSPHFINDLALEAAQLGSRPRVLDAGCGWGGTMFRWYEKIGGFYHGLTLSRRQVLAAEKQAKRLHLDPHIKFFRQSYDDPLPGSYDAIVAIEALIHSPNLERSLANLSAGLLPEGKFIIVDDMVREGAQISGEAEMTLLRSYWHVREIPPLNTYREWFQQNSIQLIIEKDLSSLVPYGTAAQIQKWQKRFMFLKRVLPLRAVREGIEIQMGGLALQQLHLRKKVGYYLLVGQKSKAS
ncbi:MAG: hypothetical protein Kow0042_28770 [Calditrichia bacterium]